MPVSILPYEASLPPLDSLLPHKRRMVAFCMASSSPLINPTAARLPLTFSSHFNTRATDSLRHLLYSLWQNYISLHRDQHKLVPAARPHPPTNSLCYMLRPVVAVAKTLPLLHLHLLPIGERPPSDPRQEGPIQPSRHFLGDISFRTGRFILLHPCPTPTHSCLFNTLS